MSKIAIIIEFDTVPETHDRWVNLVRAHAKMCLQKEPGCIRFELHHPLDALGNQIPNKLLVNELFESETFVAQRKTHPYIAKIFGLFDQYNTCVRYLESIVEG